MFNYNTPGVYFEWQDDRSRSIDGMRTDIAGFVGIAERGPLHQAVKISSWMQFTSVFGQPIPQAYLAYAVQGFFANGGRDCWVVRAADPERATPASLTVQNCKGQVLFGLEASSPGVWGQNIRVLLQRTNEKQFNLFVRLPDGTQEIWRDLDLNAYNPNVSIDNLRNVARVLYEPRDVQTASSDQPRQEAVVDARSGSQLLRVVRGNEYECSVLKLPIEWSKITGSLKGGTDGLVTLTPAHLSGVGSPQDVLWGLATFNLIDEISIVAMPDSVQIQMGAVAKTQTPAPRCDMDEPHGDPFLALQRQANAEQVRESPPQWDNLQVAFMQQAMISHCEVLKDRVALIDPNIPQLDRMAIINLRNEFDSKFAALYYPWIGVLDPNNLLRFVPPCGHVAGMYARVDQQVGVHKPPANEVLQSVHSLSVVVDDTTHGMMNTVGVNVIRALKGQGIRVMGARTMSSDSLWRYINVRRLIIMIEEAIETNTHWMVFESSNYSLWADNRRIITAFLTRLWRRGMLDGATANAAFRVTCDETTNPPNERDKGLMITEIGLQPPWPAEFVIIRIGKTKGSSEVLEEKADD